MIEINDKFINELPNEFKKSYLDYKNGIFNTEEWGSHQPLLIHLVNTITDGDVIELGIGDNSTPLLHLLCEKLGRKLFSYEFDTTWFNKYKSYENDNHKLFLLDAGKFRNNEYEFNKYSIGFIDSHPAWTRQFSMNFFRNSVDYFIVHDTSYIVNGVVRSDNNYDFSQYKNVLHFTNVNRVSTLFSNKEIPEELRRIFNKK